jgi:hypothetical protein
MAEQAWFSAESASGEFGAPPPPPMPSAKAAYELRPLTTGELLDRTFYLYRSNFWLFVGLAAIAAAVNSATGLGKVIYLHYAIPRASSAVRPGFAALFGNPIFSAISILSSILSMAVYSVTQAATTSAVTSIYLGDATSMKQSFRAVIGHWFRYMLIALWQIWSGAWIVVVLVTPAFVIYGLGMQSRMWIAGLLFLAALPAMVYGMIAYIRNSFGVPAAVMEDLKTRKSIRRSKVLTSGTKWRVFLLFLFMMALYLVAVAIQTPLVMLVAQHKNSQVLAYQAISLFVAFLSSSVIGPVGAIGLCLFYIDQRIRKEGFDIEFMIDRAAPIPVAPPPPMPALLTAEEPVAQSAVENPNP